MCVRYIDNIALYFDYLYNTVCESCGIDWMSNRGLLMHNDICIMHGPYGPWYDDMFVFTNCNAVTFNLSLSFLFWSFSLPVASCIWDALFSQDWNLALWLDTLPRTIPNSVSIFLLKITQYGGHVLHTGGESGSEPHVCLHLGLTDYRLLLSAPLVIVSFLFILVSDIDRITLILKFWMIIYGFNFYLDALAILI